MKILQAALAAAALAAASATAAQAAVILAPVSVSVTSGGTANATFFDIGNVINQSGLSATYAPGVTEFEDYIASDPTHEAALGTRWLSQSDVSTARIVFDFGRVVTLSKLALWDDRSTTVSRIRFSTPDLGVFRDVAVDDVIQQTAHAQTFDFRPVTTQFLTFEITGCNNRDVPEANWPGCGLNEVIFAEGIAGAVPEPATWAMMILGFGGVGATLRRRRRLAFA